MDPLGTVKFMNGTAHELLEWSPEEAVGRDLMDLLAGSSEIRQKGGDRSYAIGDILDTSLFHLLEGSMVLKSRSGEETAIEITSAPIMIDKDRVVGVVMVMRRPMVR